MANETPSVESSNVRGIGQALRAYMHSDMIICPLVPDVRNYW